MGQAQFAAPSRQDSPNVHMVGCLIGRASGCTRRRVGVVQALDTVRRLEVKQMQGPIAAILRGPPQRSPAFPEGTWAT